MADPVRPPNAVDLANIARLKAEFQKHVSMHESALQAKLAQQMMLQQGAPSQGAQPPAPGVPGAPTPPPGQ